MATTGKVLASFLSRALVFSRASPNASTRDATKFSRNGIATDWRVVEAVAHPSSCLGNAHPSVARATTITTDASARRS